MLDSYNWLTKALNESSADYCVYQIELGRDSKFSEDRRNNKDAEGDGLVQVQIYLGFLL